jgi:hypothetical protein
MRDRHLPRLCRSCDAPMAGQEDSCWKCGAGWDDPLARQTPVRVVSDRAAERPDGGEQPLIPATVARESPALARAQDDADRWTDEGGRVAAEAPARTGTPTAA